MNGSHRRSPRALLLLGLSCSLFACVADRQLGLPGLDGDGDGDGSSGPPDSDGEGDSTSGADSGSGESGTDSRCDAPAEAPTLTARSVEVDPSFSRLAVAQIDGVDAVDVVLGSEQSVQVLLGGPEGWSGDGAPVQTDIQLPDPLEGMTLGRIAGSNDIDLVIISRYALEVWVGDGSGAFAFDDALTIGLGAESVPINGMVAADIDLDDRDELIVASVHGQLWTVDEQAGSLVATDVATDFSWIDSVHVASWPRPGDPLHLFVAGYGPGVDVNLAWAPVGDLSTWSEAMTPFIHIGDMVVGSPGDHPEWSWIGLEVGPGGSSHITAMPDLDLQPDDWRAVGLDAALPRLAAVNYGGGIDVVVTDGMETLMVDIDCGDVQSLDGPPVGAQLRVADLDGDGIQDLVGLGDGRVVTHASRP